MSHSLRPMTSVLRPITPRDHDWVLDANETHVEVLSPLDQPRLDQLLDWADRADIIEHDGQRAGFVITMAGDSAYDGFYFGNFRDRYAEAFYYLDRIVVTEHFHRLGLGSFAYNELENVAARHQRMALEVDIEPPNEASIAFHRKRGYVDLVTVGETEKSMLMVKEF